MQQSKNIKETIEFFMSKMPNLDQQTQADVRSGKKEFHEADFYIRKKLGGGTGIQDLIKETDSLAASITNIDKAKLYKGQDLLLFGIGMAYAYSAATTTPDTQDYSSNIYKINDVEADAGAGVVAGVGVPVRYIPVSVVNSEFAFTAGGNLIYKGRTKKFFAEASAGYAAEANDENCVLLKLPKLVKAEALLKMQLEFGADAPALANNHFVEVRLSGLYLADR